MELELIDISFFIFFNFYLNILNNNKIKFKSKKYKFYLTIIF